MPEADPTSSKPFRAKWWVIGGTFLFVLLGLSAILFLRDSPRRDDSDFQVDLPTDPGNDNGLVQFRSLDPRSLDFAGFAIPRRLSFSARDVIQHKGTIDHDQLDEFVAKVQPQFAEIDRILQMPVFCLDAMPTPETRVPELSLINAINTASMLAFISHQHAGDYSAAVTDTLRLRRLAVRFAQAPGILVDLLAVQKTDSFAVMACGALLNDPQLPRSELARLRAGWGAAPWGEAMQVCINVEYLQMGAALRLIKSSPAMLKNYGVSSGLAEGFWAQLTLRENSTRNQAADYFRLVRAVLDKNYDDADWTAIHSIESRLGANLGALSYLSPNFGGRLVLNVWVPAWANLEERMFLQTAQDRLAAAGLAARAYYEDHYILPANLEELTPQYLPAVPIDPYDGKPLRYNRASGLIYSVGKSLKDTGGSTVTSDSINRHPPQLFDPLQPTLPLTFQNPIPTSVQTRAAEKSK